MSLLSGAGDAGERSRGQRAGGLLLLHITNANTRTYCYYSYTITDARLLPLVSPYLFPITTSIAITSVLGFRGLVRTSHLSEHGFIN